MNLVTEVWTPAAVLAAAIGGTASGALVIGSVFRSLIPATSLLSPRTYGLYAAAVCVFLGLVFWSGQAIGTYLNDGPVERVVSRFMLWLLFSAGVGIGVYARMRLRR